jgi:hypothetical protein
MGNIVTSPTSVSNNLVYCRVKRRLQDKHIQTWFNGISSNPKLTLLDTLKQTYESSSYLKVLQSPVMKSIFTKIRIGNSILNCHNFDSETRDLSCPMCDLSVPESVSHFILVCPKYEVERALFLEQIGKLITFFYALTIVDKLKIILDLQLFKFPDSSHVKIINTIVQYIKKIHSIRSHCRYE